MSEPIKVLYVLDWFPNPQAGGTETQFWRLFNSFNRTIVKPKILLLKSSEFLQRNVAPDELQTLNVRRLRSLPSLARLFRALYQARRQGFKVVHTYFNDSSIVIPLPFSLLGGRVIISRRDLGFWYTRNNLRILRALRPAVDFVVCNSTAVSRTVAAREGYPNRKLRVIYNAVGKLGEERSRQAARERYGLLADSLVVSVVANLRPIKRVHDLIMAVAIVRKSFPGTKLLIIGGQHPGEHADYADYLKHLVQQRGLTAEIRFVGAAADAADAIIASDVCVLPSESEGLANVLLEYAQLGRPVVCTDVGGNNEVVSDGITGLLYPVGDVQALARRIMELFGDETRRTQIGAAARAQVEARFPVQVSVDAHVALYRQLAGS